MQVLFVATHLYFACFICYHLCNQNNVLLKLLILSSADADLARGRASVEPTAVVKKAWVGLCFIFIILSATVYWMLRSGLYWMAYNVFVGLSLPASLLPVIHTCPPIVSPFRCSRNSQRGSYQELQSFNGSSRQKMLHKRLLWNLRFSWKKTIIFLALICVVPRATLCVSNLQQIHCNFTPNVHEIVRIYLHVFIVFWTFPINRLERKIGQKKDSKLQNTVS